MSGLVPLNPLMVLDYLKVRLYTPPAPLLLETPWQLKTPSNTLEFGSQLKLVKESFTKLPITAQSCFQQLIKGTELMLHQNALQKSRITKLKKQLAVITKRKGYKRKHFQIGSTLKFSTIAN